MRGLALTLLVVILLLTGACGTSLIQVTLPELDGVTEVLGYSLAPTSMPEGFEFDQYDVLNDEPGSLMKPFASILYKRFQEYAYHNIILCYPQSFTSSVSDDFLLESLGIAWRRPDDAVSEVKVNGKMAYLVCGSWSAESLNMLISLDAEALATYTPSWDYNMYLSLFFDFELSTNETIGVMIRAMLYPEDWITAKEMVAIAESLQHID
jgi:hypothetical protein